MSGYFSSDNALCDGGRFLIVGLPATGLSKDEVNVIREVQPAGFIFFSRNLENPLSFRNLVDQLRDLVGHEPIFTIDQEGGRVSRLKAFGSEPPGAKELGEKADLELIRAHGELTAQLLRLFGLNFNLAPVLDMDTPEREHNSLKGRSFSSDPQEVCRFARAFIEGLKSQGILCCGKHFPGYSFAPCDPHLELPQSFKSKNELEAFEWIPFRTLQNLCDSFMIAHIRNLHLDPSGLPASLSSPIIDIIRKEWHFDKLLLSDDIDMGAIINHYSLKETLELSLKAGVDILLLCHRFHLIREAAAILSALPESVKEQAARRVENFRMHLAPPLPYSQEQFQHIDHEIYALREKVLGKERAKQRSIEDGKRSPVEIF
ncbi:glycoside hydrolase family 3 N-terminal domain-containing protein [Methylacidiphilum caldifontis]|uniref:Beta-glucosidase n=1 Tax=Methylacidiphilum caldifontis TaxID=2795386 RepID=A0A4Y8PGV8_9BACT|nr:glycoside hydrolase family 3 N-terminal domain-containing protein [Methylacidiphilum caldifontis]QSR88447.1 glycoside hydrolase family 3 protein [Methylacidiphilum caldifontis]TFE71276.1 beta-glucosidase [Methylacidiphilum caldifontis]